MSSKKCSYKLSLVVNCEKPTLADHQKGKKNKRWNRKTCNSPLSWVKQYADVQNLLHGPSCNFVWTPSVPSVFHVLPSSHSHDLETARHTYHIQTWSSRARDTEVALRIPSRGAWEVLEMSKQISRSTARIVQYKSKQQASYMRTISIWNVWSKHAANEIYSLYLGAANCEITSSLAFRRFLIQRSFTSIIWECISHLIARIEFHGLLRKSSRFVKISCL